MKKSLFVIAFTCITASFTFAQDSIMMTSKRGVPILPDSGDWGLGFDASPFFKYIGNMFHGTDTTGSPSGNFTGNSPSMTIYGKKCIEANKFYRGKVRLGFGSQKWNYEVPDKPTSDDTIQFNETFSSDERNFSHFNINLSGGIEMRRGKGRVQGFYGAEVFIGFGNSKITNSYHNAIDSTMSASTNATDPINQFTANQNPPQSGDVYGPFVDANSGKRINEIKYGSEFSFGVRGFVGIEYFFMAKASIGAELGWGIGLASRGGTETITEYYEANLNPNSSNPGGPRTETHASPGSNSRFNIDTDNAYGAINLFFYF